MEGLHTKAILSMRKSKALVTINGKMAEDTSVSGKKVSNTALAFTPIVMAMRNMGIGIMASVFAG